MMKLAKSKENQADREYSFSWGIAPLILKKGLNSPSYGYNHQILSPLKTGLFLGAWCWGGNFFFLCIYKSVVMTLQIPKVHADLFQHAANYIKNHEYNDALLN